LQWDIDFNIPIHCFIFSKNILKGLTFKANLPVKEGWIMWLDVFKKQPKVAFINKPLAMYRLHGQNTSQNKEIVEKNIEIALAYILKNETFYFDEFFQKIISSYKQRLYALIGTE